jgi:hypothetical protein
MDLHVLQCSAQALVVRRSVFFADAGTQAGSDLQTKATALADFFQTQLAQTQSVLIRQFTQLVVGSVH